MRVVIGEDETLLRHGLMLVLEEGGFTVVEAVADATGLESAVHRHLPDLVITDIRMPPTHTDEGLQAALHLRRERSGLPIVVLSQHVQRRYAIDLLADHGGHLGYLLKQRIADIDAFCADLRHVVAGETVLDPEVVSVLMARAGLADRAVSDLTPRQREVLALMAQGRSNAWIAAHLRLSEKAVVKHTSNLYDALGLQMDADDHRRVLAVVRYLSR